MILGLIMPFLLLGIWFPNTYNAVVYGVYEYYDFHITSLGEYLYEVYGRDYFFILFIGVLFILLPFQVIKDYYYKKKKRPLALWKKMLVIMLIVSIGLLSLRSPLSGWYTYYLAFVIGIGAPVSLMAYFLIDRYVENQINNEKS